MLAATPCRGRRRMSGGRWWRAMHRASCSAAVRRRSTPERAAVMNLIHRAMHHVLFLLTLLRVLKIFVIFFVHLRVRSREGWIDVLWSCLVFGGLDVLHTSDVSLLEPAIFIQGPTHEVSGIGQLVVVHGQAIVDRYCERAGMVATSAICRASR